MKRQKTIMSCHLAILAVLLLGTAFPAVAQHFDSPKGGSGKPSSSSESKTEYKTRIIDYVLDETLGEKTRVEPDTLPLNYQLLSMPERESAIAASFLANGGSPFQSMIYTDRKAEERFIFAHPYDHWKASASEWHFTNTTRPWTNGTYRNTIANKTSGEEYFRFFLTANFNSRLNLTAEFETNNARGYYTNLASRDKGIHVSMNYQGPRYEAFLRLAYNRFYNKENGGITDDRYITEPMEMSGGYREVESLNIPVYLNDTYNQTVYKDIFLNHKYRFGYTRIDSIGVDDSVETFVPVASIVHTFHIDNGWRRYESQTANLSYYNNVAYYNPSQTRDSSGLTTIRNTIGFAMEEGFRPWVKFGLTAYLEHEYRNYATISSDTTTHDDGLKAWQRFDYHKENLLWAGGRLVSKGDSIFQFRADGKFCFMGYAGNFDVNGGLQTHFRLWKKLVNVHAEALVKNETPDYLMSHYYSNHYSWDNDFKNQFRLRVAGGLRLPDWGTDISLGFENLSNYVYFGEDAKPAQLDSAGIQVLFAEWKQHFGFGIFNFDFDLAGQMSSRQEVLPLPAFAAYGNIYIKTYLSKVLLTQIGVDCRYFTKYYAPAYNPAVGMYHTQSELQIGNYPYMNVYANFHLKRARFYIMYAHLSRLFAEPNYFQAPHYPRNPASIMMGLSWNFYD